MRIDIVSLFPDFFDAFFNHSIIKRAIETERLSVGVTNPRDFSHNKHGQVDDTPYGGGAGSVTDVTSASSMQLLNVPERTWSRELFRKLNLDDKITGPLLECGEIASITDTSN